MPIYKGSWYSQLPPFGWFDREDKPGSAAYQVGGRPIPDSQQGIALPNRSTLGKWFNVTPPGGGIPYPMQQTDIGPAKWTGRGVDISAAGAHQMGYTPQNFPTDAAWKVEPRDEPRGLGSPAGMPVQAGELPDNTDDTAVASGPPQQQGRRMPANSLMDMFSPRDIGGQPTGIGDMLAQRSNSLIGLGLGLMSGTREDPYGNAMRGYAQGASSDQSRYQSAQSLAERRAERAQSLAERRAEAMRSQYNTDRSFKEGQRQFNAAREPKPSVHWTPDRTDEKGDTIPGKPYLVNPNGSYRELTFEGARNLSSALPQTGVVPGAPAPDQQASADESAIPSTATPVQSASDQLPINRRKAIDAYSKETGEQIAKSNEKQQAGTKVIGLIDRLISKTQDPDDPKKDSKLFAEAAGPTHEYASRQEMWNPARIGYEYTPLGPSKEAQGFLGQIRSDAQAINSELQRAYLSGQGAVTENERAQISDILGKVAAARSPQEARGLLNNAKEIIAVAMQKGYATPGAAEGAKPAAPPSAKTGLEGMSKKEIQQELIRRGVLSANSL